MLKAENVRYRPQSWPHVRAAQVYLKSALDQCEAAFYGDIEKYAQHLYEAKQAAESAMFELQDAIQEVGAARALRRQLREAERERS